MRKHLVRNPAQPGLLAARTYIIEHFAERPTTAQLRAVAGARVSKTQFIEHFRAAFRNRPAALINHCMVKRADALLLNPDLRLCDIAPQCGMASPHHLVMLYRKHRKGIHPTAARHTCV